MSGDDEDFEEVYGKWEPKLYHAAMSDIDRRFAVLVGGPRDDDPYTIVLRRDTLKETFSRDDVRRELRAIQAMPGVGVNEDDDPSYVAISRNGDIYIFGPQKKHTIIPGTRAESEDGNDISFSSILPYEGKFLVAGSDDFLKLGIDGMWTDVAPFLSKETPYNPPEWTILGKGAASEVFIVAVLSFSEI